MHCMTLWPVGHVTKYSSQRINTKQFCKTIQKMYKKSKNTPTLPPPVNTVNVINVHNKFQSSDRQ